MGNSKPRWVWTAPIGGQITMQFLQYRPKPPKLQTITHKVGPRRKRK